jgi:diacylglycerol kinase (ATP)
MKHVFIVNPAAGDGSVPRIVRELIGGLPDCEVYETKGPRDATAYIQSRCAAEPEEKLCFVACGGDGTVNEVASGAAMHPNACMTVLPLGSGNDFVKAFGGAARFQALEALLRATPRPIDILKVGERWAVNAFHFGLDSAVAKTMNDVKPKPLIGGKNAYPTGVAKALIFNMRTWCRMEVDGGAFHEGDMLLCTVANGQYVGGSYRCAPRSLPDDGLAEICLVKPVSRLRFLRLMNAYKAGSHLEDPRFAGVVNYRRGRIIDVSGKPGFIVSLDGEIVEGTSFRIEVIPGGLLFAVPKE